MAYSIRVFWRARKANYRPDWEDWLWYTALPLTAHLTLLVAAGLIRLNLTWSLFTIAADTLLFLFVGIHNSWDTVTYIAMKAEKDGSSPHANHGDGAGEVSTARADN